MMQSSPSFQLTGVATPSTVEGRSLAPVMQGSSAGRDSIFAAYRNLMRSVRTDRWKLNVYFVNGTRRAQLFDVGRDPWERKDLAGETAQVERLKEMETLLARWMRDVDDPLQAVAVR